MRTLLLRSTVAILLLGPVFAAQNAAAQNSSNNVAPQNTIGPVNSPEPITMIALAGGAAAAGGLAHRRRKRK